MKKKGIYIIISVSICLLIGFLSRTAALDSVNDWYLTLNKPSFTPDNWVFVLVWVVLYILMGIAAGLVWAKGSYHIWVKTALYHFGFQLLLNALWSIVFFGYQSSFWALLIILVLVLFILFTINWFRIVSTKAAYLMIPYLLWTGFITLLNYKIWVLN
ncbi:MAG: sensory protein TspO [Flavobacteriaceae bacterium]|nr:MAG: sensory protein TspO [Flavobacteriaceae bacterium]